jgi:predicted small lipoprotein YifL
LFVSCVRGLLVITFIGLALAACGRQGPLEPPPGAVATTGPASPPAPGSGGPTGPRPFVGPGASSDAAPDVAVVGQPRTAPRQPGKSFLLDPLL